MAHTKERIGPKEAWPRFGRSPRWSPPPALAGHSPPAATVSRSKNPVARIGPKVARPRFGRSPRWRLLPMVSPEPLLEPKKNRAYWFRPGTVALRDNRRYQRTTGLLLSIAPFVRLVKEITASHSPYVDRWTPEALVALQTAAEYHVIDMLERANLCAIHANHVTIKPEDIQLASPSGAKAWVILMEEAFLGWGVQRRW